MSDNDKGRKKTKLKIKQEYRTTYRAVIRKSHLGESYCLCKICQVYFLISYGGLNDIKKHLSTKKHISMANAVESSGIYKFYYLQCLLKLEINESS